MSTPANSVDLEELSAAIINQSAKDADTHDGVVDCTAADLARLGVVLLHSTVPV